MPRISIIRVRRNGISMGPDSAWQRELRGELGEPAEFLEIPHPAYHSAREFAEAFLEAVGRAKGRWIHLASEQVRTDSGALARVLARLEGASGVQGAVMAARLVPADGRKADLFAGGFSTEAVEIGKAENPGLADPSWLLSFFVLGLSQARLLAEDMLRTVDPTPDVLAFAAAHRIAALIGSGTCIEVRETCLTASPIPGPEALIGRVMEDFKGGRDEDAMAGLDAFRLGWGHAPVPDLYRCVFNAKHGRIWEAVHMTRGFLRRNPGNPQATELLNSIGDRTRRTRMAFSTAARSLAAIAGPADPEAEQWLFEKAQSLHDQAVLLVIGETPARTAAALAYACLESARRVHVLTGGADRDLVKAALARHDLDDFVECREGPLDALRGWGGKPRPDLLVVEAGGGIEGFRECFRLACGLVKEGGWVVLRDATPERTAAWGAWVEALRSLGEGGRAGALAWGKKLPAGAVATPAVAFPELWRRMRLDYPNERTMISKERFRNAFSLARIVDIKNLAGAVVECGVWKGGGSAALLLGIQEGGSGRHLWAFDSFQGLPKPTDKDCSFAFKKSAEWGGGGCECTEDDFRETLFGISELKDENVHICKGWFQDTIPAAKAEIGPISILRIDGDWYESVMVCLEQLYDQVEPGGYILIDDYGFWEGARKATDEFRAKRGIRSPLITTDHDERYWVKLEEGPGWAPGRPLRTQAERIRETLP